MAPGLDQSGINISGKSPLLDVLRVSIISDSSVDDNVHCLGMSDFIISQLQPLLACKLAILLIK